MLLREPGSLAQWLATGTAGSRTRLRRLQLRDGFLTLELAGNIGLWSEPLRTPLDRTPGSTMTRPSGWNHSKVLKSSFTKSFVFNLCFFRRGQRWWGHQRDTTVNKILNRSKNYFCKTQRYETPIKVFLYAIQLNTRLSSSFASLFPHFSPFLSLLNCLLVQAGLNQLSAASSGVRFPDPLDDGRFSKSGGDPIYV